MTAKEYLSQAFKLNKLIKAKESGIQQLRDMQQHVGGVLDSVKVQTSPKSDPMAEITVKLLDLVDEYQRDINRLLDLQKEISQIVDTVERDDYRLILIERYINLNRWEDIAADHNYTWRHVHRLHARALSLVKINDVIECQSLDTI